MHLKELFQIKAKVNLCHSDEGEITLREVTYLINL